jgi:Na+-translocating ferredoxin:NAD+ oxidoreductase subunit G
MSHAPVSPVIPAKAGIQEGLPSQADVPPMRLILTLTIAGAMAGLLIVTVFQWAQPRIQAYQAEVLRVAVAEVLKGPAATERFFVHQGVLVTELPGGLDTLRAERVFLGYDAVGAPIGYAITGAEPGFADLIHVIFGYEPATERVLGMKVLDNRETPGLGDAIVKDRRFVSGFEGVLTPLLGVKPGAFTGAEREVAMITGATISARTVINVINNRVEQLHPILRAHQSGGAP